MIPYLGTQLAGRNHNGEPMNYVLTLVLSAGGVNETFVPLGRNVQSRLGERVAIVLVFSADHIEVCRKCAVRCDPVCAKAIPFNTKPECFRAGFGLRK